MMIRTLDELNLLLVNNLHKIRTIPFDVIVHLPRSGTIPASLLATYLIKPFASVDEYCAGNINIRKSEYSSLHRILLVDDSIRTGTQMIEAVERIKKSQPDTEIYSLCVFSTKFDERLYHPTLCLLEHEDTAYIYPWFMWKTKHIQKCAVDMDGVLCRDCLRGEDDEDKNYINFLESAEQKFKTEFRIGAIVTSRLGKYRKETESWLKSHGVIYDQLIMGPWENNADRNGKSAQFKASFYRKNPFSLFIESSVKEAASIAEKSGKKVWCIDNQKLY